MPWLHFLHVECKPVIGTVLQPEKTKHDNLGKLSAMQVSGFFSMDVAFKLVTRYEMSMFGYKLLFLLRFFSSVFVYLYTVEAVFAAYEATIQSTGASLFLE